MIYINKNHNLFSVISHNSTNGKKVLGPLLASVIINNPLQKKLRYVSQQFAGGSLIK